MNFMALLSRENVLFLIDSYVKDSAFTAVKRDAKKLNKVCERGIICQ